MIVSEEIPTTKPKGKHIDLQYDSSDDTVAIRVPFHMSSRGPQVGRQALAQALTRMRRAAGVRPEGTE